MIVEDVERRLDVCPRLPRLLKVQPVSSLSAECFINQIAAWPKDGRHAFQEPLGDEMDDYRNIKRRGFEGQRTVRIADDVMDGAVLGQHAWCGSAVSEPAFIKVARGDRVSQIGQPERMPAEARRNVENPRQRR